MGDKIDELVAPDEVMHDVPVRAQIHRAIVGNEAARHDVAWHQPAPAHAAGEARRLRPEQACADGGTNAVGADDNIGLDHAAVGKMRPGGGAAVAGLDRGAARAEMEDAVGELPAQHLQEIGAVEGEMRRPEPLAEQAPMRRWREMTRPCANCG